MVPQDLGVTLGRSREAERLRQDRRQPIRTFQQFARKCKIHIEPSRHRTRAGGSKAAAGWRTLLNCNSGGGSGSGGPAGLRGRLRLSNELVPVVRSQRPRTGAGGGQPRRLDRWLLARGGSDLRASWRRLPSSSWSRSRRSLVPTSPSTGSRVSATATVRMARSLGVLALAASCRARHPDTGALLLTSPPGFDRCGIPGNVALAFRLWGPPSVLGSGQADCSHQQAADRGGMTCVRTRMQRSSPSQASVRLSYSV